MELCEEPYHKHEEEHVKRELFENLRVMHSLKMVHRDMKENNIGWSPSFRRWVFLDFGFTTILKEGIGEKTWTKFIGTFSYTIKELQ